jgi:hypothetical protein
MNQSAAIDYSCSRAATGGDERIEDVCLDVFNKSSSQQQQQQQFMTNVHMSTSETIPAFTDWKLGSVHKHSRMKQQLPETCSGDNNELEAGNYKQPSSAEHEFAHIMPLKYRYKHTSKHI